MLKCLVVFLILTFFNSNISSGQLFSKDYHEYMPSLGCVYDFDSMDGGIIAYLYDVPGNSHFTYLTRINKYGDSLWYIPVDEGGGCDFMKLNSLVRLTNGNYLLSAFSNCYGFWFHRIVRYSSSGTLLSTYSFLHSQSEPRPSKVYPGANDSYYIVYAHDSTGLGYQGTNGSVSDRFFRSGVMKFDANDNEVWSYLYKDTVIGLDVNSMIQKEIATSSSTFYDGGFIVNKLIDTITLYDNYPSSVLERIDPDGNLLWQVNIHGILGSPPSVRTPIYEMFTTSDSCIVLTCYKIDSVTTSAISGPELLKFNAAGVLLEHISIPLGQQVSSGVELSDGDYLFRANNVNASGLARYTSDLSYISFQPEPFEHPIDKGDKLIPNQYGGAFYAYQPNNSFILYSVNFDSLMNIYDARFPGNLTLDINTNCQVNTGDQPVTFAPVKMTDANNNEFFAFSDVNGHYNADVPLGTYTVSQPVPQNKQVLCPSGGTYNYTFSTPGTYAQSDFYDSYIPNMNDITLSFYPATFVPGFNTIVTAHVSNVGSVTANSSVTITLPNNAQFNSSIPAPTSTSGNVLTYDITNLDPDATTSIEIDLTVDQSTQLGSLFLINGSAPLGNDVNPGDNNSDLTAVVIGSFDPNDKAVNRAPICTPDEPFIYKVRFQNTGTYHAKNVVVVDTISDKLDMSTFKLLETSHPMLNVSWSDGNKVTFTYHDIYLPDSNTNEPGSHGYFIYSIKPKTTVTWGDSIENTAHIYFDFNQAVITNTTLNIIGWPSFIEEMANSNTYLIYPNPVTDVLTIRSDGYDTYTITNILGQQIKQGRVQQGDTRVNMKDLPSGIYSIKLSGQSGSKAQKLQKL